MPDTSSGIMTSSRSNDASHILHHGDCLDVLRTLADGSIDAVVTDPPYGLKFMGKAWDYDVPGVEVWREVLRVLKPGGHLLSFFGTRTYHRGACWVEDAGFEIRDQLGWMYGSGFPKSHDVSKAIDKALGAERPRDVVPQPRSKLHGDRPWLNDPNHRFESNVPATPEAATWQGWGTALKPAWEPIVLARKPLSGTVAANVLEHGTGALNVEGCRVPSDEVTGWGGGSHLHDGGLSRDGGSPRPVTGRYPANVLHDGSDDVVDVLGPAQRFFYCAKASRRERGTGNHHPTVKPVALMRYLVKLITPPGGIVLDPFMGSGTTGVACVAEQRSFIGIERDAEYVEIARQRIEAAT